MNFFRDFPRFFGMKAEEEVEDEPVEVLMIDDDCRKRSRESESGSHTPTLVSSASRSTDSEEEEARPIKRFRSECRVIHVKPIKKATSTLSLLPEDLLAQCLGYLGSAEDRFALQCTNKQFKRISSSPEMLKHIEVGGDKSTGLNGIIQEHDTAESASLALSPYVDAGNAEAIYMVGIIKSYCYQDVEGGKRMLKTAASQGYVRANYALGLILRDADAKESYKHMKAAADQNYLPALQEILPARELKTKVGEPGADELRRHLDPLCLNRLLCRHYVKSSELKELNTSHCWNPLCGRWAFKVTVNSQGEPHFPRRLSDWRVNAVRQAAKVDNTAEESIDPAHVMDSRVSRMKMCSRCCRAKYCSKLCQVYDWRSGRHKMECQFLT